MRTSKVLLVILLLIPAATPCRAGETPEGSALLRIYIDVWNGGAVERLAEIVSPDFRRHGGPDESCRSLADLEELVTRSRSVWRILRITVEDAMATSEGGAVRGGFYGVHRSTNGIIEFPTMSMFRFVEGKIAEEWVIGDNFLSLMALGYELVPPGFEVVLPRAHDDAQSTTSRRGGLTRSPSPPKR